MVVRSLTFDTDATEQIESDLFLAPILRRRGVARVLRSMSPSCLSVTVRGQRTFKRCYLQELHGVLQFYDRSGFDIARLTVDPLQHLLAGLLRVAGAA